MKFKYFIIAALIGVIDINALKLTTSWDGNAPYYVYGGHPIDGGQVDNFANNDAAHQAALKAAANKYQAIDA